MLMSVMRVTRQLTMRAYPIRGIGLGRVCEAIRKRAAHSAPAQPVVVEDFQGHGRFACHVREHMGSHIFFRGAYSYHLLPILRAHLPENGVFLDIGANQGEFTVAGALLAPRGRVISIEPVSKNRRRLQVNIELNLFEHVVVVPLALSDEEGELEIYDRMTEFDDGTMHEGLATLYAYGSRTEPVETVQVRRLDKVAAEWALDRLDVVKIDVEGAEWPALRGGEQLLRKHRPVLIIEVGEDTCRAAGYAPEDFCRWLDTLGYDLHVIDEQSKTRPLQAGALGSYQNLLAIPRF